jgi:biopolymer transport protein TolR
MGGGAMPEGGGGGGKRKRRPLDAVINVVPAIDLLSCCIAFLLFTAVWTQISRLQAQQFGTPTEQAPEPQKSLTVTLVIGARGFFLQTSAGASFEIPPLGRAGDGQAVYDLKALGDRLKQLKADYPDQAAVTVAAEDMVLYQDLVRTIDACVGAGLGAVSVTAAG